MEREKRWGTKGPQLPPVRGGQVASDVTPVTWPWSRRMWSGLREHGGIWLKAGLLLGVCAFISLWWLGRHKEREVLVMTPAPLHVGRDVKPAPTTWTKRRDLGSPGTSSVLAVSPERDLLALVRNGGGEIVLSVDGGASWVTAGVLDDGDATKSTRGTPLEEDLVFGDVAVNSRYQAKEAQSIRLTCVVSYGDDTFLASNTFLVEGILNVPQKQWVWSWYQLDERKEITPPTQKAEAREKAQQADAAAPQAAGVTTELLTGDEESGDGPLTEEGDEGITDQAWHIGFLNRTATLLPVRAGQAWLRDGGGNWQLRTLPVKDKEKANLMLSGEAVGTWLLTDKYTIYRDNRQAVWASEYPVGPALAPAYGSGDVLGNDICVGGLQKRAPSVGGASGNSKNQVESKWTGLVACQDLSAKSQPEAEQRGAAWVVSKLPQEVDSVRKVIMTEQRIFVLGVIRYQAVVLVSLDRGRSFVVDFIPPQGSNALSLGASKNDVWLTCENGDIWQLRAN